MSSLPASTTNAKARAGWAAMVWGAAWAGWTGSYNALAGSGTTSGIASRGTAALGREWHLGERLRAQTSGVARLLSVRAVGASLGFPEEPRSRAQRRAGVPKKGQLADSRPGLRLPRLVRGALEGLGTP